jgi:hypothetical protein
LEQGLFREKEEQTEEGELLTAVPYLFNTIPPKKVRVCLHLSVKIQLDGYTTLRTHLEQGSFREKEQQNEEGELLIAVPYLFNNIPPKNVAGHGWQTIREDSAFQNPTSSRRAWAAAERAVWV